MSIISGVLSLAAKAAPFFGPEGMAVAPILGALSSIEPAAEQAIGPAMAELHSLLQTEQGKKATQAMAHLFGHFATQDPVTGALIISLPDAKNDPSSSEFYGN